MTQRTDGFTLIEMLVGLLVLSFATIALSLTLSTAFNSFERLRDVAKTLSSEAYLNSAFELIGNGYHFDGQSKGRGGDTHFTFTPGLTLIAPETSSYKLKLSGETIREQTIYHSDQPIRLRIDRQVDDKPSKPVLILERQQGSVWSEIARQPLWVSADPSCRYDLVGHRCR